MITLFKREQVSSNNIFKTYFSSFRDLEGALSAYELLGAITAFTLNFLLSRT